MPQISYSKSTLPKSKYTTYIAFVHLFGLYHIYPHFSICILFNLAKRIFVYLNIICFFLIFFHSLTRSKTVVHYFPNVALCPVLPHKYRQLPAIRCAAIPYKQNFVHYKYYKLFCETPNYHANFQQVSVIIQAL